MLKIPTYTVDAFTSERFSGNPAAVCILETDIGDELKQKIAAEMNLAETAFILPRGNEYDLRWFTPSIEVDLCGHATLAGAHVLWESGLADVNEKILFKTKSGRLELSKKGELISMLFPLEDVIATECPELIIKGINANPVYSGRNRMDYLVEVESEEVLRNIHPHFAFLGRLDSRGLIVTSSSDSEEYDFVSRFFAPQSGIPEDSVTGSAHCALAPYWSAKLGRDELVGFQASGREGIVYVKLQNEKVVLGGYAVTVLTGYLSL